MLKKAIAQIISKAMYRSFRFKKEGVNCRYRSIRSVFKGRENTELGDNVWLGPGTELHGEGGIRIGNGVVFAPEVLVYTRMHNFNGPELAALPFDDKIILKPVAIGDYAWVGRRAIILPGVEIGRGAIVGAGAVVSKSIPDYGIAVGNPATVVNYRDKDKFNELVQEDPAFVYEKLGHQKSWIQD